MINPANFTVFLNALQEQGDTKVLSNPKLSVMNGQPALITVGRNVTYIESVEAEKDTDDNTTTYTVNTERILSGIGMAIAGVPAVGVLTAVVFILCIAQLGPGLVLIPAVIWLFYSDQTAWGTILLVWSLFVGTIDNVLRPVLIRKGADLPLLLIFAGVIGGLITFGIAGLFIGPVVLAITYRLLAAWLEDVEASPVQEPAEKN
jgi:predicted PurR-regulated permease PerM